MTEYIFELNGEWKGSWNGQGLIKTNGLETEISVDPSMKGRGIGTNPDELLTGALASCYLITLGIRLEKERIACHHLAIRTKLVVTKKDGLHVEQVIHHPVVFIDGPITPELQKKLISAIHQAEGDCMVAKAVRGNVDVIVKPSFKSLTSE